MSRLTSSLVAAALIGQLVGLLGWIDALFFPLALAGPLVTGAVGAAKRLSLAWVACLWCSAGVAMLWTDWLVHREDVVFHLALSLFMPLLAALGHAAVTLARRSGRDLAV